MTWTRTLGLSTLLACAPLLACSNEDGQGDAEDETSGTSGEGDGDGDGDGDMAEGDGDGDTEEGPDRDALLDLIDERGPYTVGFQELELTYTPPGATEPRTIPVLAWYPALEGAEAGLASYSLAGLVQLPNTMTLDAPPVSPDGPFPVVVYSHGSGGAGILAYPFAERFASHGWILVSADHVGNTVSSALNGTFDSYARLLVNRPSDVSAMLDELEGGFEATAITGAADLESVFLFGHSFGGYTTFATGGVALDYDTLLAQCEPEDCEFIADPEVADALMGGLGDPRIDAISPQAPALYSLFAEGAYAALEIPTLLQSGKLDITTTDAAEATPAWNALDNPDDVWLDLPFGGHYSFITICHDLSPELLALVQPENVNDGCGPDFTPTTELIPELTTYLLGFANQHVLGESDFGVIFEGAPLHPEIDVLRH